MYLTFLFATGDNIKFQVTVTMLASQATEKEEKVFRSSDTSSTFRVKLLAHLNLYRVKKKKNRILEYSAKIQKSSKLWHQHQLIGKLVTLQYKQVISGQSGEF